MKKILLFFIVTILLINPVALIAFETDQFNLSPEKLNDIGDEVTNYTKENLEKAIEKINAEILIRQECLTKISAKKGREKCDTPQEEQKRLEFLRSEDAIALEFFRLVGKGVPFSISSKWLESEKFEHQPARFKPSLKDSIYVVLPTDYIGLSSTINMYGAEFGTDKIAHLYQQGYDYFKIYKGEIKKGLTHEEAIKKAVKWGQKTERTYYGTLVSGVYSNADLAANYAGLYFHFGLTRENKISDKTIPPTLILENGIWKFNSNSDFRENLLKPYISESFSEALNPSIYTKMFGLNLHARHVLERNCDKWLERFPDFSQVQFAEKVEEAKTLFGENYGFRESKNFVTIANTCFDSETETKK